MIAGINRAIIMHNAKIHRGRADIEYAQELGYVIKLLGIAKRNPDGRVQIRVHPALLPASHPLAGANDVYNAIMVKGDSVGDVMFYGRGAGSGPTGSAVVGDIIDVCRNLRFGATGRVPCTCIQKHEIVPIEDVVSRHFIRMVVRDRPRVMASISSIFGDYEINIASMVQREIRGGDTDIIWIMHETPGRNIVHALERIKELDCVVKIANWLRIEE